MPVLNAEGGEVIAGEWRAFNRCPRCKGTMVSNLHPGDTAKQLTRFAFFIPNVLINLWLIRNKHYGWMVVWGVLFITFTPMITRRLHKPDIDTTEWTRWLPPSPNPAPDSHNITSPST